MTTRTILLIGALLAVAAGFGILILGEDSQDANRVISNATPELETNADSTTTEIEDALGTIATNPFSDDDWARGDESDESTAILVLDAVGKPVKGARVDVFVGNDNNRWRRRFAMETEETKVEPAASATSDQDGLALFKSRPVGMRDIRIKATKGDLIGFTRMNANTPAPEENPEVFAVVKLQALRRLEITVRDTAGLPAGHIQVQIAAATVGQDGERRSRRMRGHSSVTRWTAEKTGTVALDITPEEEELFKAKAFRITATLYGADAVTKKVKAAEGSVTRADVVIPVSVTLTALLKRSDGKAYTPSVQLQWRTTQDEDSGGDTRSNMRMFFMRSGRRLVKDGRTRIGGFRPGATVTFEPLPKERMEKSTEVALPTSPGDLEVDVMVGDLRPSVVAILLEPAGYPAAKLRVRVDIRTEDEDPDSGGSPDAMMRMIRGRMSGNSDVRTSRKGRIRIPIKPGVAGVIDIFDRETGGRRGMGMRGRGRFGGGQDSVPLATLRFTALDPGQKIDLGTITLDRGAVLVSGRILDKLGKPQQRMRVRVRGTPPSSETAGRRAPRPQTHSATTNSSGEFKVFAAPRDGHTYTISATSRGSATAEQPFEAGTEDLELVATRTGAVKGRVRLAHPEISMRLDISVRQPKSGEVETRGRGGQRAQPRDDGTFTLANLVSGIYDLEVRADGIRVFELKGLEVPEGESLEPAELADLIVGEEFFKARITVLNEAGSPIRRARISVNYRGAATGGRRQFRGRGGAQTDKNGVATPIIDGTQANISLSVSARNFITAKFDSPTFPLAVTLLRTLNLSIILDPPLPELEGLASYRLSLVSPDPANASGTDADVQRMMRSMFQRRRGRRVQPDQKSVTFSGLEEGRYTVSLAISTNADSPLGRRRATVTLGEVQLKRGLTTTPTVNTIPAAIEAALQEAPLSAEAPDRRANRGNRGNNRGQRGQGRNRRNR